MVESSVVPERDVLLATKLHMPASRPGLVPRRRLTARLEEGLARGLVLVCAPAGYGKTVLLADWARRGEHPAAWLSLDASLAFLLEHRPAGIGVVLASRSDPPLALARLRARGQLAEVRVAELRFTPAEAAELLQQVASALPDASVAALAARTEGWAAGLQLAALSLRGQADAAAFVAAFTGSHRYVLDYLAEEVLERQPGQLRAFLLETSVLERLSGPAAPQRRRLVLRA